MKKIALSLAEGRVVRDLFENGFLDLARECALEVICFTPSTRVPEFIKQWSSPNVQFHFLKPYTLQGRAYRGAHLRGALIRRGRFFSKLWKWLEPLFFLPDASTKAIMQEAHLAILTNPLFYTEMDVYSTATALGIPTLGVVRSWDNLYKGFRIYPDKLAVWNQINRQEAVSLLNYDDDQVFVVGSSQFDIYFASDSNWEREYFAQSIGLDPARPILTIATLGAFLPQFDETYLVDIIIDAIKTGRIKSETQLIIRLHPASKLEYFSKYKKIPNVFLSYITGYIPTLGWTMSRDDVVFVANLLRHSDVVISPGSTITVEAAIFDTPTIVPIFNQYQPELYKEQYERHLSTHFKRLADLNLIPIVRQPDELIDGINHALFDRSWYRDQRNQLVHDYIEFTDGRSLNRLVDLMTKLAN